MRLHVATSRVGRLCTVGSDGSPHVVPVCFTLLGDVAYSAIDHKPKRSRSLRRIANIQATGLCCLLVDEYDEDWARLWWVRLDAHGRVVDDSRESEAAFTTLAEKYPQYTRRPPGGAVLAFDIKRWSGWSATCE